VYPGGVKSQGTRGKATTELQIEVNNWGGIIFRAGSGRNLLLLERKEKPGKVVKKREGDWDQQLCKPKRGTATKEAGASSRQARSWGKRVKQALIKTVRLHFGSLIQRKFIEPMKN